jgi:hypothetical protein
VRRGRGCRRRAKRAREWVAIPQPDRERWQRLLTEARDHADPPASGITPVKLADTTTFGGFSAASLAFLTGLERDNSKRYFDTHRRTYQQQLLERSKTFVVVLGTELRHRISERLHAEPRIGGSLFRIANDLRFAKDKQPYKPTSTWPSGKATTAHAPTRRSAMVRRESRPGRV